MVKPQRIYGDACTWIAYIIQEKDALNPASGLDQTENRYAMCKRFWSVPKPESLRSSHRHSLLPNSASKERQPRLVWAGSQLFWRNPYVLTVSLDMAVGEAANSMLHSGLLHLKPPDAIHIA